MKNYIMIIISIIFAILLTGCAKPDTIKEDAKVKDVLVAIANNDFDTIKPFVIPEAANDSLKESILKMSQLFKGNILSFEKVEVSHVKVQDKKDTFETIVYNVKTDSGDYIVTVVFNDKLQIYTLGITPRTPPSLTPTTT